MWVACALRSVVLCCEICVVHIWSCPSHRPPFHQPISTPFSYLTTQGSAVTMQVAMLHMQVSHASVCCASLHTLIIPRIYAGFFQIFFASQSTRGNINYLHINPCWPTRATSGRCISESSREAVHHGSTGDLGRVCRPVAHSRLCCCRVRCNADV